MGLKRLRTTIKDIANYTGFSVTTISLVLNNKAHKIPKSTKDTILDAAEKLNYHPNQLAVGLVKKRTDTIGLIISDVSNVFFSNLTSAEKKAGICFCAIRMTNMREIYLIYRYWQTKEWMAFCFVCLWTATKKRQWRVLHF